MPTRHRTPDGRDMTFQPPQGTEQVWAVTTVIAHTARPLATRHVRYRTIHDTWAPLGADTSLHPTLDAARTAARAVPRPRPGTEPLHAGPRPRPVLLTPGRYPVHATHGPDFEDLGARLGYLRRLHRVTQQQAADAAGIPRTAVSEIESGTRKVYALELRRLAIAYGHPDLDQLLHALGDLQCPRPPTACPTC